MRTRSNRRVTPIVCSLAAASLLLVACGDSVLGGDQIRGSGDVTTETRPIGDVDRIVLAGEGAVLLGTGADGEIEVETDDNLHDRIETEVSDGTLTISTDDGIDIDPTDGVIYRLGCPRISAATLAGAGTIDLSTCTTTGRLELTLAGAGLIRAPDLDVSELQASLPGAGSIEVDGVADRLELVLSGAGDIEGVDLRAAEANVDSTGAVSASLWVTERLDLRMTGAGSIRYHGDPSVTSTITGVGRVETLGPKAP